MKGGIHSHFCSENGTDIENCMGVPRTFGKYCSYPAVVPGVYISVWVTITFVISFQAKTNLLECKWLPFSKTRLNV